MGFLDVIIEPIFSSLGLLFDLSELLENIEKNRTNWVKLAEVEVVGS